MAFPWVEIAEIVAIGIEFYFNSNFRAANTQRIVATVDALFLQLLQEVLIWIRNWERDDSGG